METMIVKEVVNLEVTTKMSVNVVAELSTPFGVVEMCKRKSITLVRVVPTNVDNIAQAIIAEGIKIINNFPDFQYTTTENGLIAENENGSLKIEMSYRLIVA